MNSAPTIFSCASNPDKQTGQVRLSVVFTALPGSLPIPSSANLARCYTGLAYLEISESG